MAAKTVRAPLSRDRVLAAATAIADADGLRALTMRRLAADLGIEAMSLYYHLPGKDGLLDGLVEAVSGEINAAVARIDQAGDWRALLRRRFLAAREVMLRHPWAPGLFSSRPNVPVGVMHYYEGIMATLVEAGFSYRLAHRALHAFGSMALGFVQETFRPASEEETAGAEPAELTEALPHLTAMVAAELHDADDPTLGWCDSQTEFQFTLDLLLDGLDRARTST
jgi:AcrR family transcriptional regulator